MTKPTLLALTSLEPVPMARIEDYYNVIKLYKESDPDKKLSEVKNDVQAVVATMRNPVRENLISALPNLEIISLSSVGYDNVDVNFAKKRDIIVTNAPDVVTNDTADAAIALLLCISRRFVEGDVFVRVGRWEQGGRKPIGQSLSGKKAGIVGLGRVGKAIAKKLEAFDLHISYHGRTRQNGVDYKYYDNLVEMAQDVDYLILACPGGAETKYLVDKNILLALGENGYLINVSRGSVVNEIDLVSALYNKTIAGAGLDVYEDEPNVPDELKTMDNVVLFPHMGVATWETFLAIDNVVADNLIAHVQGRPVLTPIE